MLPGSPVRHIASATMLLEDDAKSASTNAPSSMSASVPDAYANGLLISFVWDQGYSQNRSSLLAISVHVQKLTLKGLSRQQSLKSSER